MLPRSEIPHKHWIHAPGALIAASNLLHRTPVFSCSPSPTALFRSLHPALEILPISCCPPPVNPQVAEHP